MTYPKPKACPVCDRPGEDLTVYKYDNGWRHVECDGCYYLGPGESSVLQAIRSHNERAARISAVAS